VVLKYCVEGHLYELVNFNAPVKGQGSPGPGSWCRDFSELPLNWISWWGAKLPSGLVME